MLTRSAHNPFAAARHIPAPQLNGHHGVLDGPARIVGWFDRYVPWTFAGGELALHHMLRGMVRRGHDVDVLTTWPTATWDGQPHVVEGVRVWPESEAARLLDQADVLVGHLLWTKRVVQAAALGQIPLVYVLHNTFTLEHWQLRPNDVTAVVYNAEWVQDHTLSGRHSRWRDVPSVVCRPPVKLADYTFDPAPGRATAGHVTLVNPNPDKGAYLFYDLARERPGDRFLAVAGGYGQQVHPRQPEHRNVVWQNQTSDMVCDVYARTRVLLMPSRYESWGRVAVEAMCSGIPVVAHPTPGLREALGDAAIYADRGRPKEWHRALDRLADPNVYVERSTAAWARARDLDAVADRDLAGFEWLILTAATAERVPSAGMSYDPYRAKSGPPHSVERSARRPDAAAHGAHHEELAEIRSRSRQAPPPEPGATPDGPPPPETQPQPTPPSRDPGAQARAAAETAAADAMVEAERVTDAGFDSGAAANTAEGHDPPRLTAEVPTKAPDVVAWINEDGIDNAVRYDRAEAAEYVEDARDGDNRVTVTRAYEPVLYQDDGS
jgi:glycosyltransferase involved in cell wall biosynthesis